jgi:catechol 2,3-dioxygenase-like lactoylglutathione lyase family enzyme
MKRFHVHVAVKDLESSIRFYSALFGAEPTVTKTDYAKWMVDDPRINFAISERGARTGVNHLGLQVDSDEELEQLRVQAQHADLVAAAEKNVSCCYARGNKYWYTDPQGVAWETYHTLEQVEFFSVRGRRARAIGHCGGVQLLRSVDCDVSSLRTADRFRVLLTKQVGYG